MNFSDAVARLEAGEKITRTGWKTPGMHVEMLQGEIVTPDGERIELLPHPALRTPRGGYVLWLPNQLDLLASDWEIV